MPLLVSRWFCFSWPILWLFSGLWLLSGVPSFAAAIDSELEGRSRALAEYLDSEAYRATVEWDEHVVLAYQLTQERDPSPLEFVYLSALRSDIGFSRSGAFSVALRGSRRVVEWADLARFFRRHSAESFQPTDEVRLAAERLANTNRLEVVDALRARWHDRSSSVAVSESVDSQLPYTQPWEAGADYQIYFGYLHAHSDLSDGKGDPDEAYAHARDVGGLDYFGLTDHGEELIIFPWDRKWDELKDAAADAYAPGSYATLWGFEWSNPLLGHINVINSDTLTESVSDFFLTDIYRWIVARPGVFGRFNHPGRYDDLLIEFRHLDLVPNAVGRMVAIETFDKNGGFDEFHYDCEWLFCATTYLDEGNGKGWFLGAAGGQDNHDREWGDRNDFRTAVLATELTREAVLEAYQRRRIYATEDSDLELDVRVGGFPMGSRLSAVARDFEVSACDGGGDLFEEIRLYRDGAVLETRAVSGNCVLETFSDPGAVGSNYYYVIIRQTDDGDQNGRNDEAISSPFWID